MLIVHEDHENRVYIDTEVLELQVELKLGDRWELTDKGTYPNLKVLSASFRDAVSYGKAYDVLIENEVPKESFLWDLNHSNPWRDENGNLVG